MHIQFYLATITVVLADVNLPESSYKSTACYTPLESPVYLNCSTSFNDIIAISSFKAIAKKLGSVCISHGDCCGDSETGDCTFTYWNVQNPGKNLELYQECMGHERTCRYPVRVPRIPTPQVCANKMSYSSEIDFVEVQYYCINEDKITSQRPGKRSTNQYEIVYLQTKGYPHTPGGLEEIWCEVSSIGANQKLIAVDVQLKESDILSVKNTRTCANLYTFPKSYTNKYRLKEITDLTNNFYLHFKGYGKFWVGFQSRHYRISINCGIFVDASCRKEDTTSHSRTGQRKKATKDEKVVLWWIALIVALILGTVISVYFCKRHKDKQKIKADKDLEYRGPNPADMFAITPAETNLIAPINCEMTHFQK